MKGCLLGHTDVYDKTVEIRWFEDKKYCQSTEAMPTPVDWQHFFL